MMRYIDWAVWTSTVTDARAARDPYKYCGSRARTFFMSLLATCLRSAATSIASRCRLPALRSPAMHVPQREMHFQSRLGRGYSHRQSMMKSMVTSLIEHERIKTPLQRAKEVSRLCDRMVTHAKRGDLKAHRLAAKYVRTRSTLAKLFTSERRSCKHCLLPAAQQ